MVVYLRIRTVLKYACRRKTVIFVLVINNNCNCSVIQSRGKMYNVHCIREATNMKYFTDKKNSFNQILE